MSFDAKLFIALADELINQQKNSKLQEAYNRTAISRSYYSVYWIAREYLCSKKGFSVPIIDSHKKVREEFKKSSSREENKIGKHIDRLWKDRKDADYEKNVSIDQKGAKNTHTLAIKTLALLDKLP